MRLVLLCPLLFPSPRVPPYMSFLFFPRHPLYLFLLSLFLSLSFSVSLRSTAYSRFPKSSSRASAPPTCTTLALPPPSPPLGLSTGERTCAILSSSEKTHRGSPRENLTPFSHERDSSRTSFRSPTNQLNAAAYPATSLLSSFRPLFLLVFLLRDTRFLFLSLSLAVAFARSLLLLQSTRLFRAS